MNTQSWKILALMAFFLLGSGWAIGQGDSRPRPCDLPEGRQFDFWLGEWELSWPAEQFGGPAGTRGHGTNVVTRILDGCIIQESFAFPEGNFYGHSFSAYDAAARVWRQTWVDNRGGYLTFTGTFKDGVMELRTEPYRRNGTTYISRMVFRNITPDALDWDWQRSADGGQTWEDIWNIHYRRKQQ
ncbi:MAG: DUF1579 domain-containing protein [Calditrichaeota bacterium]|nr:MAG: DUF1579 domain-containing protein [Calditrichota bacterium]